MGASITIFEFFASQGLVALATTGKGGGGVLRVAGERPRDDTHLYQGARGWLALLTAWFSQEPVSLPNTTGPS